MVPSKNSARNKTRDSLWQRFPQFRLLVEASLWSADATHFGDEIKRLNAWADMYHMDVADGHFVPGFLFYADLVAALRPLTSRPFHVHLMTDNPCKHIADFAAAGADIISVQAENGPLVPSALEMIHQLNIAAGLVLGLDMLLETIQPWLKQVELVVLMGTPLGVKGLPPSEGIYARVEKMKELLAAAGMDKQVKVFVDGGIREDTVPRLRSAGADGVVAGSLVFKSPDISRTFEWLHTL